jgi:hypothetical protein
MGKSTTSPQKNNFKVNEPKPSSVTVSTSIGTKDILFPRNTETTNTNSDSSLASSDSNFTVTDSASTMADSDDGLDLDPYIDSYCCWACGSDLEFTNISDSGFECFDCGFPN